MPKQLTNLERKTIAAYLPEDLARQAREHAQATRRSLSSVVAEALDVYFERERIHAMAERFNHLDEVRMEGFDHEAVLQQLAAISTEQARLAEQATRAAAN